MLLPGYLICGGARHGCLGRWRFTLVSLHQKENKHFRSMKKVPLTLPYKRTVEKFCFKYTTTYHYIT